MSSTYSAESEDSALDLNGPGCEPSRSAKSTLSAERFLPPDGRELRSTEMSENCVDSTLLLSMSSAEASLAKTSRVQTLESVVGWRASIADYGLNSSALFAKFDPDTSSWRTSQSSVFGGWELLSETWPQSGMTRSGTAYRVRPLAPTTYELASGFLPTPVHSETGYRRTAYSQGGRALSTVVGGPVNPEYQEWMMGFPVGWTDVLLQGTQFTPESRKPSDAQSSNTNKSMRHDAKPCKDDSKEE